MPDMNWRDKDDLELTSEDIDAMLSEGQAVGVRGPRLPGGARIVTPSQGSSVYSVTVRPGGGFVRVGPSVPA